MLSRVAESLYWLGRNVERAETIARVLDVNYTRAMDLYAQRDAERLWRSVMHSVGFLDEPAISSGPGSKAAAEAIAHCALDPDNPCSIVSSVRIARSNGLGMRAELTTEVWQLINVLYLYVEGVTLRGVMREGPSKFLHYVRDSALAFSGVTDATLTHGDGWGFLQVGRFLERAYMTSRFLVALDVEHEPWRESQRLLEMCCADVPFAQASRHVPEPRDALEFIILSADFPRALRFCTRAVDAATHRLSRTGECSYTNAAERRLGRLRSLFDFTSIDEVLAGGIAVFSAGVVGEFENLSHEVEDAYFPRHPVAALVT